LATADLRIAKEPVRAQPLKTNSLPPARAIAAQKPSERKLVEEAKTDPAVFGQLYEANYERILNYIYRRILNLTIAEELTSNTFFKALRALPTFHSRGVPIQAWLYRIAGNEIKAHYRADKKRRKLSQVLFAEHDLDRVQFNSAQAEEKDELQDKIRRYALLHGAISRLPERYQTVLVLRYFEGLKLEQIVQVLGKRIGTVKSLIHRGLARLRKIIHNESATFLDDSHYQ